MNFYLIYFIAGIAIEYPILRYFLKDKMSEKDLVLLSVSLNAFTHPLIIYVLPLGYLSYITGLFISETAVILVEGVFISEVVDTGTKESMKASLAANVGSWQLAPIIIWLYNMVP